MNRANLTGRVGIAVVAAMTLALTSACGDDAPTTTPEDTPSSGGALTSITIGVAAPTAEQSLPSVAAELGFFEEQGIEAEVTLIAGGPQITAGLVGGSLDFGVYSAPGPEVGAVQGADLKYVGVWTHLANLGLVVAPGIESVEDLEGEAVAVSSPGTTTAIYTDMLLTEAGMDPATSVTRLNVGGQGEALNAFASGQVKAAIFGAPVTYTAVASVPGAKILIDYSEQDVAWPYAGVVTTEEMISDNGDLIVRVLTALQAAAEAYEDPARADEVKAVITTFTNTLDEAVVTQAFDVAVQNMDTSLMPREEDHANVLEQLAITTPQAEGFPPEDVFDASFAEQLNGG